MLSFFGVVLSIVAFSIGWFMRKRISGEVKEYERYIRYAGLVALLALLALIVQANVQQPSIAFMATLFFGVGLAFVLSSLRSKESQSFLNVYLLMMALWLVQFVNVPLYSGMLFISVCYLLITGLLAKRWASHTILAIIAGSVIGAFMFVATRPTVYAAYLIITFCIGGVIGSEMSSYDIRRLGKARKKRSSRAKNR